MKDIGHVTIWDVECIIIEDTDGLFIIPKQKENIKKIRPHFEDRGFFLKFTGTIGFSSVMFIERMQFEMNHAIKLFPRYIINRRHADTFTGFEMTGEAIDDFFSPSRYFYDRPKSENKCNTDFIYHSEIADKWTINFEDEIVTISLSFGDILRWGVASDLKLHPKLTVEFKKTSDVEFVYRVYSSIVRFLQIIRYDTKCGIIRIDLLNQEKGKTSYNGYLRDFSINQSLFFKGNHEVEYGCYKPYIQRFLQFAADNPEYTFYHYPLEGVRYLGSHYSAVDYMNIFSAFESECHAKKDLYENVDASNVQAVKNALVDQLNQYPRESLKQEETDFIEHAKERILQLGTQFGQTQKIINAYQVLRGGLDGSIENIFYLPEFKLKGPLQINDLKKIAVFLTGNRGAVAHGGFSGVFSDKDAQKIHFLEILTYAQTLKRMGLEDIDVERVIGAIFGCNIVLAQEKNL